MQVVFVQTAFLGDLLLSVPALKKLKSIYPNSKLTLVCRKGLGSLIQGLGLVDNFFEIEKGDRASYKRVIQSIPNTELVVSAHRSVRTALFVKSMKAKKSVGFKSWWSFLFYSREVVFDSGIHDALRQLSLVKEASKEFEREFSNYKNVGLNESLQMEIPDSISSAVRVQINPKFSEIKNPVLIYPGSVWATKRWTQEGFTKVCKWLVSQEYTPVLMGSPDEKELCEKIKDSHPQVVNYAGALNLFENIQLLSQAKAALCNDNGGQHLASIAGVPTLSIFGPTSVNFGYRAWNSKSEVIHNEISCSPCGPHGHKKCPLGHHKCMTELTFEAVKVRLCKILRTTSCNPQD